jgi:hypothetical protein
LACGVSVEVVAGITLAVGKKVGLAMVVAVEIASGAGAQLANIMHNMKTRKQRVTN